MKNPRPAVFLSFLAVAALLVFFMPRGGKFSYVYEKGKPWAYETLFAQFDFPIIKTEEQISAERYGSVSSLVPYFRYSEDVVSRNVKNAEALELGALQAPLVSSLKGIYEKGVVTDEGIKMDDDQVLSDVIYIQRNKRAVKSPAAEVYKVSDARKKLLEEVTALSGYEKTDSVFRSKGVYNLLVPNLIYDSQTTALVNSESTSDVSPTMGYVAAGQQIVADGEIVTAEVAQILDSYAKEYEATVGYDGAEYLLWIGKILMALALVTILFFAVYLTKPKIFFDQRIYYVLLIFAISAIVPLVVAGFREDLLYCIPFTLSALYLQAFFRPKLIVPVYMASLLPLLVFTNNGPVLFVMYMVAGPLSMYLFQYLGRGWKQFLVALVNFAALALVYLAFHWLDAVNALVARILVYLFIASVLQVLGYPLIYLFEKIFNLVSNSRLTELCDTSNPLIRELEQKAPGTFQHSLQVMSMADSVARAVDANPLLVRAGALYHDIGKMNNPQCFIENESLISKEEKEKYHYGLTPAQSAHDILRHVTDGYEMAHQHHIPEKICEFILTHHGTSVTLYFYNKFINEGGSPEEISAFRYAGRKPFTKEHVILMLCDSIEAASRTLTEYTPEAYSKFVERIVEGKMKEGQLDEADISIKELGIVKEELKNYLAQSHHERIAYPKRIRNK